jgi:hypothetical protein
VSALGLVKWNKGPPNTPNRPPWRMENEIDLRPKVQLVLQCQRTDSPLQPAKVSPLLRTCVSYKTKSYADILDRYAY